MTTCLGLKTPPRQEGLAQRLFDAIPEDSLSVILMDRHYDFRASHPEQVDALNLEPAQWQMIRERLDDGGDPVVLNHADVYLVAAQLEGASRIPT